MGEPHLWTSIPCWCSESSITCSEGTEPGEEEDAQLGNASGRGQSCSPQVISPDYGNAFSTVEKLQNSDGDSQEQPPLWWPLCGCSGTGCRDGVWEAGGGSALLPPFPNPFLAWRGSAGESPTSGLATCSASGAGSSQQTARSQAFPE